MVLKNLIFLVSFFISITVSAEEDFTHYAFANYLGSGIYKTSGQNATVVNIPISFDIRNDDTSSLILRTPVSLGFFNFTWSDLPEGEFPDNVGTMTVTPGIEYRVNTSDDHEFQAYIDLGYGNNFTSGTNVAIYSAGVSSLLDLQLRQSDPVWVNRLFFAGYSSFDGKQNETYSALQSGVDIGTDIYWRWDWLGVDVEPRFFAAGYWYFDKLRFATPFGEDVLVSHSLEIGATLAFSKPILWEWMGIDRLGLSVRAGDGVQAWRLIFEFPI
ncbi:hypothetical protein FM038_008140 [Shewanella eurypsychrophilus]|uniref:Uncharacterized protein n=1 Tax=Shewanella eurypsychrophilus TaxID=2593656 RepID=A0ABX6V487_9GAMM|nr:MULTISPECIES: hypothetical protein [Shewanella]QFU22123.1 hypothetical protein FS418_09720 [Shewanella sp. YLB-09]QPG57411.1 hypothetical protein FM038_008140 [Shewanella eurypsychrophilus]